MSVTEKNIFWDACSAALVDPLLQIASKIAYNHKPMNQKKKKNAPPSITHIYIYI